MVLHEETAVPSKQLKKLGLHITYQKGLPESYSNARGAPSLIILDDLLNEAYGRDVCDLFTEVSVWSYLPKIFFTKVRIVGTFP